MKQVLFLFDEHVGRVFQRALRRHAPSADTLRIGQPGAPSLGTGDPEVLLWCENNKRLFVSFDRSTLPTHFAEYLAAGHTSWGVILIRPAVAFRACLDDLLLVHDASDAKDWRNSLTYLPFP